MPRPDWGLKATMGRRILKQDSQRFLAVSLFSNCGAGDVGYRAAGFRFSVMAELEQRRLGVALLNHAGAQGVVGDLRQTWPSVVELWGKAFPGNSPDLLAACPPCQGMSSARAERGLEADPDAGTRDPRNLLVVVIAEVANRLSPRCVVVENVPAFFTRRVRHPKTGEPISAARYLIDELLPDYSVYPLLVDMSHFGVPQQRKRAFLTFIRRDEAGLSLLKTAGVSPYPVPMFAPDFGGTPVTVRDALIAAKLPALDAATAESASSPGYGTMHSVPVWPDRRYDMVAAIPPNGGGSAWQNNKCFECGDVEVADNDAICPHCGQPLLRPVVLEQDGTWRLVRGFRSSSYRRLNPNLPATTVTTASGHLGSDSTIHPWENRLLSIYECALLQTFPHNFKWGNTLKRYGTSNVRAMIGEAVPPRFTTLHGSAILAVLSANEDEFGTLLRANNRRCLAAWERLGLQLPECSPPPLAETASQPTFV